MTINRSVLHRFSKNTWMGGEMKYTLKRMLTNTSTMNIAFALLVGAGTASAGTAAASPQIASASQLFTTSPTQLQIEGSGFGAVSPTVYLGVTPLFVLSFTDTVVFASVPAVLPPGSYTLVLTPGGA